ncbi:hypothetical protein CEXT_698741 [Caerostris extrusa]|uniref:Uncharacterized protein n=1 Tax=Caerostris extrusa TaxID=172846 RepID=A0AAV4QRA9_CAEEX|nr:hypothetical protein CEXT_698741 [Caerostris extrusa]
MGNETIFDPHFNIHLAFVNNTYTRSYYHRKTASNNYRSLRFGANFLTKTSPISCKSLFCGKRSHFTEIKYGLTASNYGVSPSLRHYGL